MHLNHCTATSGGEVLNYFMKGRTAMIQEHNIKLSNGGANNEPTVNFRNDVR